MVNKHGSTQPLQDIISNTDQFDFTQLMRLLEQLRPNVQLIPSAKLNFPVKDIRTCEIDKENRLIVELNFMGLCGVDSPLPHYFLEYINHDNATSFCLRKFLDIFNNHIYSLLYQAWKKYRSFTQLKNRRYLHILSGNCNQHAYCGLFAARIHNSHALAEIIGDYLKQVPVKISQFVPTWINTKESLTIGDQTCLANNTALGDRCITNTQEIGIVIGPFTFKAALPFLISNAERQNLEQLIVSYLTALHSFSLTLLIKDEANTEPRLGATELRIGWHCWLGRFDRPIYAIQINMGQHPL